jgi:hypothetical protein
LVQLPGAVDGPVPEVAGSREAEGSGGEWVPEKVADQRCETLVTALHQFPFLVPVGAYRARRGSCGKLPGEEELTNSFIATGSIFVAFQQGACC